MSAVTIFESAHFPISLAFATALPSLSLSLSLFQNELCKHDGRARARIVWRAIEK